MVDRLHSCRTQPTPLLWSDMSETCTETDTGSFAQLTYKFKNWLSEEMQLRENKKKPKKSKNKPDKNY